jgi:hypothetical protein
MNSETRTHVRNFVLICANGFRDERYERQQRLGFDKLLIPREPLQFESHSLHEVVRFGGIPQRVVFGTLRGITPSRSFSALIAVKIQHPFWNGEKRDRGRESEKSTTFSEFDPDGRSPVGMEPRPLCGVAYPNIKFL